MMESVASYHELYLSRQPLRDASKDIKRRACRMFLAWFGRPSCAPDGEIRCDLPISEVTSAMAEDFRRMLLAGRCQVSANGYINNFRAFWSWALRHGYIAANPFALVGPLKVDESSPRQTFTPTELGRMMRVADRLWRIRICLGLMGARRGEMLLGIQVRDVWLDAEPPHILVGYHRADATTIGWGVKGKRLRYLGLPERMGFDGLIVPLRQLVAERIEELGRPDEYLCLEADVVDRLLARQAAGTLRFEDVRDPAGNFPRAFRALQERAEIRTPRRFHELRAAFATQMIDAVGLCRAAELLGHQSVETTRRYDRKEQLSLVAEAAKAAEGAYLSKVKGA